MAGPDKLTAPWVPFWYLLHSNSLFSIADFLIASAVVILLFCSFYFILETIQKKSGKVLNGTFVSRIFLCFLGFNQYNGGKRQPSVLLTFEKAVLF